MNGFHAHAAFALLVPVPELDSGAVSQPHQLLIAFTQASLLANQRHDFIELDLYDPIAVDSWISLDLDALNGTARRELRTTGLKMRTKSFTFDHSLPDVRLLMLSIKWRRSPNVNFILLFQK